MSISIGICLKDAKTILIVEDELHTFDDQDTLSSAGYNIIIKTVEKRMRIHEYRR